MSEINKPSEVNAGNWQEERSAFYESPHRNPYQNRVSALPTVEKSDVDVASILGISVEDVKPEIKSAIYNILEQQEFFKNQTQQALTRVAYLENLVDRHSYLPVMNRRAFIREFSRRIEHGKRAGFSTSLILFYFPELDTIRKSRGLSESENLFSLMIGEIDGYLRASDIMGAVGLSTLGVAMPLTGFNDAEIMAESLVRNIELNPITFYGKLLNIKLFYGVTEAFENAEKAIIQADKELVRKLKNYMA